MIEDILKESKERMMGAVHSLKEDLSAIRTGRASPTLVEKLQVEYYGQPTPLIQLASISVPEPRQLLIKPFDPGSVKNIEKAIQTSELGINPNSDGKVIRLILPPLTEERRKDLVKVVHHRIEEAHVAVRNIRRDAMKNVKELKEEKLVSEDDERRGEEETQKATDVFVAQIDAIGKAKEKEVMEV